MEGVYGFLAFYERKTAEFYEKILPQIKDKTARMLLKILVIDSRKHSEVFRELCGGEIPEEPPKSDIGALALESARILDENEKEIGRKDPLDILTNLVKYEKMLNEEYLVGIQAKGIELVEKREVLKKVFDSIADDEKRHADFLSEAIRLEKASR
ncbi:MAG: hypothetical protein QFX35_03880 [Candidatus Verstraetearchaeota archaeon]|nr:hypothetical protein [Candidatus Verstraetearchaeota archaeon]